MTGAETFLRAVPSSVRPAFDGPAPDNWSLKLTRSYLIHAGLHRNKPSLRARSILPRRPDLYVKELHVIFR